MEAKKILVIGGSRFFGRYLVQNLIDQGHQVSVLNRGSESTSFKGEYEALVCDRNDFAQMQELMKDKTWDIIYDQVCFDYQQAKEACEIFAGKVGKYIFTSTKSVYEQKAGLVESDFNPKTYEFSKEVKREKDYGEAKRQAEVGFVRHASFPVTMVRFPMVIGKEDYTKRFLFHFERIKNNEPIYFPNINAKMTFVEAHEAALALQFLGTSDFAGPVNVASPDPIDLKRFVGLIEMSLKQKANIIDEPHIECFSPYGIDEDWYMDCGQLKEEGLELSPVTDIIENTIHSFSNLNN